MTAGVLRSLVFLVALATPSLALASGEAVRDALRLGDTLEVVQSEGLRDARGLADGPMGESLGRGWDRRVAEIYDLERMHAIFAEHFDSAIEDMPPDHVDAVLAFFDAGLGAEAVALEVAARESLLDDDVEDIASAELEQMRDDDDPRLDRIEAFAEANSLIDGNVAVALNSTVAFHRAMIAAAGGALDRDPADVMRYARGREPAMRDEAEDWVMRFLSLAYRPLSDDEIDRLTEFARSSAGRALSNALFAGYDTLFTTLSADVGRAAGQSVGGREL